MYVCARCPMRKDIEAWDFRGEMRISVRRDIYVDFTVHYILVSRKDEICHTRGILVHEMCGNFQKRSSAEF